MGMQEKIDSFYVLSTEFQLAHIQRKLEELEQDMAQDLYTFVVVGEFSSGKSTFINALIEDSILPTGITPTTATINVVQYAEQPSITVHSKTGTEQLPYSENVLQQFTANEMNVSTVDYIEVQKPIPFLKDRVVIVDTPGLNDVNELRSIVTYHYIPRADVVFYLLDCRAPLRQTEFEFITETLLKNGLEKIIFVANFADQIDEDDLTRVLERIEADLKKGTGLQELQVIPFSALEALERDDEELFELSGMPDVLEKIEMLCQSGTRQQEKVARYATRLSQLELELAEALREARVVLQASTEELQQELDRLYAFKEQKQSFYAQMEGYVKERELEFELMATTSVRSFFADLEEEFVERVELYQGNQIEQFFGKEIPNQMKRRLKQWIERYTPHLHELFAKLELALKESLQQTFDEQLSFAGRKRASGEITGYHFEVNVERQKDPLLTSGLLVGGASSLLLVLGGPILLPILGMVGLPFLQKKMQQDQLNAVKPKVVSELTMQLHEVGELFEDEVKAYITSNVAKIKQECIRLFEEKMGQQEQLIRQQQLRLQENQQVNEQQVAKIDQFLAAVQGEVEV